MASQENVNIYRWFFKHAWDQKYTYLLGILALAVTNWMVISIPLYFKEAFDIIQAPEKSTDNRLLVVLTLAVVFACSIVVVRTVSRVLFFNPARKVEKNIKNELYQKLNRLKPEYYQNTPTGSIISRINHDITYVRLLYGFGMLQTINLTFMFSLAPINMWRLSPQLTLYCLIPLLVGFVVVRFGIKYIMHYTRKRSQNLQNLSSFSISVLNGMDVIKNYQIEKWAQVKFDEDNAALLHSNIALLRWRILSTPILMNLEDIMKIIIFSFAAISLLSNDFTIGDLAAFLGYITLLTPPLASLGWLTTLLKQGTVSLHNLSDIYRQPEREQKEYSITKSQLELEFEKGIKINNLSFSYPGAASKALTGISFSIKPGQIVGILGKVGSGKTTLANCLTKLLKVKRGMIQMGDVDINDASEKNWRALIFGILQDPFLFSGTIKENILLANDEDQRFPDDKLAEIIKMSALSDEIAAFSARELEIVGEKGIRLSGGQKQRISIARALVKKYRLLVFDNVLSAVDYATEEYLIKQILTSKIADSLLIISHRTSALRNADYILVLENGEITEQGSHQELLAAGQSYAKLWELQN